MEFPFALEFTVSEEKLKASPKNEGLHSDEFTAINCSGVRYSLSISPREDTHDKDGETWIRLYLEFETEKKVEAEFTISIKTAKWSTKLNNTYHGGLGSGETCCYTDDLFNPEEKFIVDGKLTVNVEGILKVENAESKTIKHFGGLWKIGFEDFTIVVEKKEIKVHKNVLAFHSPVFYAMFNFGMKEAIENKVEIDDYKFEIVEMAIKMCYYFYLVPGIAIEKCFLLLAFADKYGMAIIRDIIENYLGDLITKENVCEITNSAVAANAFKLQNRCMAFLMTCVAKEESVPNMETLEKVFSKNVFINTSCHKSSTL